MRVLQHALKKTMARALAQALDAAHAACPPSLADSLSKAPAAMSEWSMA